MERAEARGMRHPTRRNGQKAPDVANLGTIGTIARLRSMYDGHYMGASIRGDC
jgi:hypothetical protein